MRSAPLEFEISTPRADDFERTVASLLGTHRIHVQGRAGRQAFHLRHKALPRLTLSFVGYGREVGVEVLSARDHWAVSKVSAGSVEVGVGGSASIAHEGTRGVYGHDCDDPLAFDAKGETLTMALPLRSLDAALAALLGHPASRPLRLIDGLITAPLQRRRLDDIASRLWNLDVADAGPMARVVRLQEELALYELLLTVPHNHYAALQQAQRPPGSLAVRRALEFLHANVHADALGEIALHDVAAHAGVGVRALGAAFQRETGVSPMRYLRQLRLDQARIDLLSRGCSVTEAATRWGFCNLGDFARYYRQRHGELPSAVRVAVSGAPRDAARSVFPTSKPP
jgi:AraC-like DNA-binding protein